MSKSGLGLLIFLVSFTVLSTVLGYAGIARLHHLHYPPFNPPDRIYTIMVLFPHPSGQMILFLDSTFGRILSWMLVLAALVVPALLIYKYDRWILGFALLFSVTALFGLIGFSLFLHGYLDAF